MNWKGVDLALLAMKQLPGVTLTVAGSGPQLTANRDLCRRLGLDARVHFAGHIEPADVSGLMSRHDVLLLPSLYEGLSNTLLEAGPAGLACMASDRGGNPEVIDPDRTGVLVDPWKPGDLVDAVRTLAADRGALRRLAERHAERVRQSFSLDGSVSETMGLLEEAC